MSFAGGLLVLFLWATALPCLAGDADFGGVWARDYTCERCETLPADLQSGFPCTDAETAEAWRVFELRLTQVGNRLTGSYSTVNFRSDVFVDVDPQTLEDKTHRSCQAGRGADGDIVGRVRGNRADVTFTNSRESGKFRAALSLRDKKLVWEVRPRKGMSPGYVNTFDVLHKTHQRGDYVMRVPGGSSHRTAPK